jgi:hypothetical protein
VHGLEGALRLHAVLLLLFQFIELLLHFFVPCHQILNNFMSLAKMIVFLFFCKKPICLQLFFLGSDGDVLADVLLLEIGGLEFLYFYFGVVVLL